MSEDFLPAEVFHPSEHIRDEMSARGWTRADVANRMGMECCVRNLFAWDLYLEAGPQFPGMRLGQDTAERLGRAFDVSPQYFLNLEAAWLIGVGVEAQTEEGAR